MVSDTITTNAHSGAGHKEIGEGPGIISVLTKQYSNNIPEQPKEATMKAHWDRLDKEEWELVGLMDDEGPFKTDTGS